VSNPIVISNLLERQDAVKSLFNKKRKNFKDQWIDVVIDETQRLTTEQFLAACDKVGSLDILPDDLGRAIRRKYYENLPESDPSVVTPYTCGTCVDGQIEVYFKEQPIYRQQIFCGCERGKSEWLSCLSRMKGNTESWTQKQINEGRQPKVTESHLLFVKGLMDEKERS